MKLSCLETEMLRRDTSECMAGWKRSGSKLLENFGKKFGRKQSRLLMALSQSCPRWME
jgi:hypothetical protein